MPGFHATVKTVSSPSRAPDLEDPKDGGVLDESTQIHHPKVYQKSEAEGLPTSVRSEPSPSSELQSSARRRVCFKDTESKRQSQRAAPPGRAPSKSDGPSVVDDSKRGPLASTQILNPQAPAGMASSAGKLEPRVAKEQVLTRAASVGAPVQRGPDAFGCYPGVVMTSSKPPAATVSPQRTSGMVHSLSAGSLAPAVLCGSRTSRSVIAEQRQARIPSPAFLGRAGQRPTFGSAALMVGRPARRHCC